jgi:hypothetical protein
MAEEIFQRPLLSFDMQGQSIKEVLLKSVKIEEIETLPEASENYNRVLFNKGELKYSNGKKWIGQAEIVGLGLVVKTNFNDSNIPKGQIDINGHRVTLFNKIDNSDLSLMPTKTIKGNRTDSDAAPTDITYANFARDMRDSTLLGVTLTTLGGMYVLKQGDVEIGRFSTSSFIDTIELVQGYWSEDKMSFTEDKEGTDLAMKLTVKKELGDASVIYLDISKLIDVYKGGTTDTINISINLTNEGYKVLAEIKEYSIKKEHLSKELNTEIEEAISTAQIQADWSQTDATQKDFIKNKPTHLPSPADSITTEQLQAGVVTNAKLANKTINFNGQTFELGAGNQNLAPLKNTGFEVAESLPTTNNFEGRQVVYQGRTYTFHNGEYQCIADDLGGREETREEQFTYQATANDESVKDGLAVVKSIKGNTVVANQIFKYINSSLNNGGYNYYIGGYYFPLKHKLLIKFNYSNSNPNLTTIIYGLSNYGNVWGGNTVANISVCDNLQLKSIVTNNNEYNKTLYIREYHKLDPLTGFSVDTDSIKIVDLTQMFGVGNEPTSVEEFECLYPNLPKEYNEGSLLNLNAEAIKSVGFNAFNGEYAKVLGGMQYYLGGNITSLAFKENLEDEGEVIEIPSDNLYTPNTNGYLVATGSDICINLSHSGYRNGEYEPYKESIVNLPIKKYFPDGMKSAGEVRDEIIWDESIKKYKAIQRIDTRAYQTDDEDLANVITDKVNTYYILETPKETIIDDYDLIYYEVSDFGTEEIIADEPTTPIVADIQYGFNAVDEIRNHRFEINKLKKSINDGVLTITQGEEILGEFSANQESNTTIELSKVASSGSYEDLENKPNISDSIITLKDGAGQNLGSFSLNQINNTDFTFTRLATQYIKTDAFGLSGVVPVKEHLCGTHPIVQAYLNGEFTLVKLVNDGYGNITWSSNVYITQDVKFTLIFLGVKIARTNVVPTFN